MGQAHGDPGACRLGEDGLGVVVAAMSGQGPAHRAAELVARRLLVGRPARTSESFLREVEMIAKRVQVSVRSRLQEVCGDL